jgi:hypothetical protein
MLASKPPPRRRSIRQTTTLSVELVQPDVLDVERVLARSSRDGQHDRDPGSEIHARMADATLFIRR